MIMPRNRVSDTYTRAPGAAKYVGLAVSTLAKLRVSGLGPKYSKLGRVVVYSFAELDVWLLSLQRSSTSMNTARKALVVGSDLPAVTPPRKQTRERKSDRRHRKFLSNDRGAVYEHERCDDIEACVVAHRVSPDHEA
jgi:predicted DNA-binding transcriptional regulator AlpA